MRKTFVTAVVVLLAILALVSCDSILTGQNEDGLVTLSVNTGETDASRSLTNALAHVEANYMEVIFSTGTGASTKYYRAEGYQGVDLKIKVPEGTYPNSTAGAETDAIILIGRKSDKTLLATGTILSAITVPGTSTVTFTVTSIVSDISKTTGTSFTIAGLSSDYNAANTFDGDVASKCFQVPASGSATTATLALDGLTTTGSKIIVNGNPLAVFAPIGTAPALATGSITSPADTDPLGASITFSFTPPALTALGLLSPPLTEAKYIITFDIPVVGFSNNTSTGGSAPLTWSIRGGTNPGQPDFTGDANEGIPILVTDNPVATYGLVVKPSLPPTNWPTTP